MKEKYREAIYNGEVVMVQQFHTEKGMYEIDLIRYNDEIYFFKVLNGKMVECCNLNTKRGF